MRNWKDGRIFGKNNPGNSINTEWKWKMRRWTENHGAKSTKDFSIAKKKFQWNFIRRQNLKKSSWHARCQTSTGNFFNYDRILTLDFSKSFGRICLACFINQFSISYWDILFVQQSLVKTSRKIQEIFEFSESVLKFSKDSSRLAELMHLVFYIWSSSTDVTYYWPLSTTHRPL